MLSLPSKYNLEPTNFTEFTILTWWYGLKEHQDSTERAVISVLKDNIFGSGFHLHAGCTDFPNEICLTFANRDKSGVYHMKQHTTNTQPLASSQGSKWNYFGFTYKKSIIGDLMILYYDFYVYIIIILPKKLIHILKRLI